MATIHTQGKIDALTRENKRLNFKLDKEKKKRNEAVKYSSSLERKVKELEDKLGEINPDHMKVHGALKNHKLMFENAKERAESLEKSFEALRSRSEEYQVTNEKFQKFIPNFIFSTISVVIVLLVLLIIGANPFIVTPIIAVVGFFVIGKEIYDADAWILCQESIKEAVEVVKFGINKKLQG